MRIFNYWSCENWFTGRGFVKRTLRCFDRPYQCRIFYDVQGPFISYEEASNVLKDQLSKHLTKEKRNENV